MRGSGTNRLVFEYTVQRTDSDGNGIEFPANALALNGATIVSDYGVEALLTYLPTAAQTGHKVGGSRENPVQLTGGICDRTPQVRDKLAELVEANHAAVTNCSVVDPAVHLQELTGRLNLDGFSNRMTGLKAGDFAGLTGITNLVLSNNRLRDIPAGVFNPLTALTSLNLSGNETAADDGLTRLPAGLFDRLTGLTLLQLHSNDLSSLPPRIFEKLTNLEPTGLALQLNPGTARFVPTAKAGPEGGVDVVSGASVTLEVEGPEDHDLWGTNVSYAWAPPAGITVTYTDGTTANSLRPAFIVPATGEDVTHAFRLTATGGGGVAATSSVNVRVAAGPRVENVEFVGTPRRLAGGRTVYALNEFIEVALRFDRAVTVDTAGGTPSVALTVGTATRTAQYRRGTDSRQLVFGYRVVSTDRDSDGVDLVANSLALNGAEIVGVSDNGVAAPSHETLAGGENRGVDGSKIPQGSDIVCGRSPAVQAAILERIPSATRCTQVSGTQLSAITGTLDVSAQVSAHGRMTALKAGDFDNLTGVTALDLDNHAIRVFPAGIFDPLKSSLTELSIAYNQTQASDSLMTLPVGLFDELTNLTTLRLEHNDLETLPDGIFQPLTNLTTLTLSGNPGSATFLPVAVAGPQGGIDATSGDPVQLGGDAGGPWGNNLIYSWRKATGTTPDLSASNVQEPVLTPPALKEAATLGYALTVTARGTSLTATDSVAVRVAATAAVTAVTLSSNPVVDETYKLGETIQAAVAFSKPVTVTGTPQLALSVGANARNADYVEGLSGTTRLVFEYTVVEGDADTDGIAIAANSLMLGSGRRDRRCRWRAGDSRPRRAGDAGQPQGHRIVDGPCTDRWHLRPYAPGARQAGGAGQGEARQRRDRELLAGDDHAFADADREA